MINEQLVGRRVIYWYGAREMIGTVVAVYVGEDRLRAVIRPEDGTSLDDRACSEIRIEEDKP